MVIEEMIMYQEKETEIGKDMPEIYGAYDLVSKIHHPFVYRHHYCLQLLMTICVHPG